MNYIADICRRLHARLAALQATRPKASAPNPTCLPSGSRLRATWLSSPGHDGPRLHWQQDDSQKPPSRWAGLLCFG